MAGENVQSVSTGTRFVNGTVSSAAVLAVAAKTAVLGPELSGLAAIFTGIVFTTVASAARERLEKKLVEKAELPLWQVIGLQLFGRAG